MKIRDDDDMKSREKFSEKSILDHLLQQHLLFDHSRNYDILITIHISVGDHRLYFDRYTL